jgi:hypothetical protein
MFKTNKIRKELQFERRQRKDNKSYLIPIRDK